MAPLPDRSPKQLSLGPLEREILSIVWDLDGATVRDVHRKILSDPQRELAYTSVTTVLNRLTQKGWLSCDKSSRVFRWTPQVNRAEAQRLEAHAKLQEFLAVSTPDIVAAFADSLDRASADKMTEIARRLQVARQAREAR